MIANLKFSISNFRFHRAFPCRTTPVNPRRPAPARPTPALLVLALALTLAPGCATIGGGRSLVPTRYETKAGPYMVYTNAPLPADAPALKQLRGLGRQLEATLGV